MKKLTPLVLAASLALAGCSYSRPHTSSEKAGAGLTQQTNASVSMETRFAEDALSFHPYMDNENALFQTFIGCSLADVVTTNLLLSQEGGHEKNPVLGKYPSNEKLFFAKAISVSGIYMIGQVEPKVRTLLYNIAAILYCGLAANNYSQFRNEKGNVSGEIKVGYNFKF